MNGKEIRERREKMEMTAAELADALSVAPATLAQWEQEQSQPDHPKMLELALEQLSLQRVMAFKGPLGRQAQQSLQALMAANAEMRTWADQNPA